MKNILLEIMDAMFIMILCFGTLLTAMLMKGGAISLSYTIHPNTFLAVALALTVCLAFILMHSEKGLKKVIESLYSTMNG